MPEPTPLVLLHAFPLDASLWTAVAPLLAAEREIVAPEFPGLGAAPAVEAASVDSFADGVAARIAAMRGGRAAVCGLSLGGYAALALAARHPQRVAALVLADTRAEPDTAEAAEGRHRAAAQVRDGGLAAFLDDFVPRLVAPGDDAARDAARAIADAQDPEAIARALEALAGRADRRADLARIAAPTLVLVGSEDGLTPPHFSETLAEGIPSAELVVIPGAGHLTALERPEEFAAAVNDFLSRRLDA
ncbi:MAG TPA: alpha/beta fold hydrolase [Miltoncostaeaceae bacterium]|nr:alpha/beta fold hydrolase [Miltoncostaeaceae bacterium]